MGLPTASRDVPIHCAYSDLLTVTHLLQAPEPQREEPHNYVFVRVSFNRGIQASWLRAKLCKYASLLKKSVPHVHLGLCWTVGQNMFQRR